jgi:DNA polymerase-3 subunit beta
MRFVLPRTTLLEMVANASVAVSKKPTLPAHGLITFHTYENGLLIAAHGESMIVQTFSEVPVGELLAFGVDGALLNDITKRLHGDEVILSIKNYAAGLNLESRGVNVNLKIVNEDEIMMPYKYSHMPFVKTTGLLDAIKSVSYATSDDTTRPQLMGILINEEEVVAVDGHRMSVRTHQNNLSEIVNSVKSDTIIPDECVDKLVKIFKNPELNVFADESSVHFNDGSVAVTVRKIARGFPKYKTILPGGGYDVLTVKRKDFVEAMEFVRVVITDRLMSVNLDVKEGFARVWTSNDKVSNIEQVIEAQFNNEAEMKFNSDYLLDVAKRLRNDTISLEIRGPLKPVVIKEENSLHVVMPQKR